MNKLFLVEGLWNTGKSSICCYLKEKHKFFYIQEPNHIKSDLNNANRRSITKWYLKEHIKNLQAGINLLNVNYNVVIERSPISSIAFIKTFFKENIFRKDILYFKQLLKHCKYKPRVIYLELSHIKKLSIHLRKNHYISDIPEYSDSKTLEILNYNYLECLDRLKENGLIELTKLKFDNYSNNSKVNFYELQMKQKIKELNWLLDC